MIQPSLFQGEEVTRRFWEMEKQSRAAAISITIVLLRETNGGTVTFHDIVKRRLGIAGDSIPEALAELYSDQFKMVRDSRHLIKDAIDEHGEFLLVVINAAGTSALRGGKPTGFALRSSMAGEADDRAQLDMTTGKLRARVIRERLAGLIGPSEEERALTLVADIESMLAPKESPIGERGPMTTADQVGRGE